MPAAPEHPRPEHAGPEHAGPEHAGPEAAKDKPARAASAETEELWRKSARYDRRAEIVAIDRLTDTGTVRITLQVIDKAPFTWTPGQFVAVEEDIPDVGRRRSPYCIMTPPGPDRRFDMLLRVFPEGPLAQYLTSLEPGDRLDFRGPSGRTMVPRDPDVELVLITTGVGISPLWSLVHSLLDNGDRRRIRLYWGLRLTDDICLVDDLADLVRRYPNFTYAISLSKPPLTWRSLRGRVTESVPPLLPTLDGVRFYLTGNGAMIEEMEVALTGLGVDRHEIHEERFFNVRHQPSTSTIEAIRARFPTDQGVPMPANILGDEVLFPLARDVRQRGTGPKPSRG